MTRSPEPYGQVCAGLKSELHDRGVLVITFDAPERMNALDQAMKRDLIELVTRAQMDDAVRVLVFTGEGRAFCAGDHMGGYQKAEPASVSRIGAGHAPALARPTRSGSIPRR
jgi:2-(1,2-epoxy-1,2-dihydrophenyl)acetyl-CoA isomerase